MGKNAVILVDHGSRVEKANYDLERLAGEAARLSATPIYPAHMELAGPTMKEAYAAAVADGATYIVVVPYFLAEGRHSREDIPRLAAEAAADFPETQHHVATPIGMDPAMGELIARRIFRCLDSEGKCAECQLCGQPEPVWE